MKDLVSICVPLYNSEKYIVETIQSVVDQDYDNIELVICDDVSKDNSFDVARKFINSLKKSNILFRLQLNKTNLGMVGNWNHVVQLAKGEYIKLMGGDDVLEPHCISTQVRLLKDNPDIGLVISRKKLINEKGKYLFSKGYYSETKRILAFDMAYHALKMGGSALGEPVTGMFRKSDFLQVNGYDPAIHYHADYDFWIRLLLLKKFYYYINDPLVSFRIHKGSATFKLKNEIVNDFFTMFHKYYPMDGFETLSPKWIRTKVFVLTHLRDIVIRFFN